MATIKVRQNGSLLVEGEDVTLIDWNGNEYALAKRPFALCRCGHSLKKPFCDGAHSRMGFQAAEAALGPAAADRPADQSGAASVSPSPAPSAAPTSDVPPAPPQATADRTGN